eukprot:TRINITY_DN22390_c0_g1_i1.p1 TRINITY_DN22390_c0_g1~~TRINITY_DN22390_c0_g1_i1.p1  ORF type:complete len:101 (+),score=21.47 TRINITY_DN22390_c0_g1_i1:180-482(+)
MSRFMIAILYMALVLHFQPSVLVQADSAVDNDIGCGEDSAPSYFGQPMLQDFRYLLSFAAGILVMRQLEGAADPSPSSSDESAEADDSDFSKFELYPYAI